MTKALSTTTAQPRSLQAQLRAVLPQVAVQPPTLQQSLAEVNALSQQLPVVLVTPELARYWWEHRATNRKITDHDWRVAQYATAMLQGKWHKAAPLIFDADGRLVDGQHRLLAVIKANIPVEFFVLTGVDPKAMQVIDSGKPRTIVQSLQIAGLEISNKHVATVNAMFLRLGTTSRANHLTDRQLMAELYVKHKNAVDFAVKAYSANNLACLYAPIRGAIARAYYHMDAETLTRFVYILDGHETEEPRDRNPFLLRNYWIANRSRKATEGTRVSTFGRAIYSLDCFRNHRRVETLREAKTQHFPVADFDV